MFCCLYSSSTDCDAWLPACCWIIVQRKCTLCTAASCWCLEPLREATVFSTNAKLFRRTVSQRWIQQSTLKHPSLYNTKHTPRVLTAYMIKFYPCSTGSGYGGTVRWGWRLNWIVWIVAQQIYKTSSIFVYFFFLLRYYITAYSSSPFVLISSTTS